MVTIDSLLNEIQGTNDTDGSKHHSGHFENCRPSILKQDDGDDLISSC